MAEDIHLDKASLVALWMETLFYGMTTVCYWIAFYVLFYAKKRTEKVNKPLLATATILYILCTIHIVTAFVRGLVAFINHMDAHGGPLSYYQQVWTWSSVFSEIIYVTNVLIANCFLVYRLYVVWSYNIKMTILPMILVLINAIFGYFVGGELSQLEKGQNFFDRHILRWGTAMGCLSAGTGVVITGLIAWRIRWIGRQASPSLTGVGESKAHPLAIVIESAAISTLSLIILMILYLAQTNAAQIVYQTLAQISGITPILIILLMGLRISTQDVRTFHTSFAAKRMQFARPFNQDNDTTFATSTAFTTTFENEEYMDNDQPGPSTPTTTAAAMRSILVREG